MSRPWPPGALLPNAPLPTVQALALAAAGLAGRRERREDNHSGRPGSGKEKIRASYKGGGARAESLSPREPSAPKIGVGSSQMSRYRCRDVACGVPACRAPRGRRSVARRRSSCFPGRGRKQPDALGASPHPTLEKMRRNCWRASRTTGVERSPSQRPQERASFAGS